MDIYNNEIFGHEPIQSNIFLNILKNIKSSKPLMIELGCAYADYSKFFNDYFLNNCENICLDILPRQIEVAKNNLPSATFIHGYVGEPVHIQEVKEDNFGAKRIYLEELIGEKKVNILHMDVQGSETYIMNELYNSNNLIDNIEYLFISLHNTYDEVKKYITNNFEYIYEHPTEGGVGDGLIVIKNKNFKE